MKTLVAAIAVALLATGCGGSPDEDIADTPAVPAEPTTQPATASPGGEAPTTPPPSDPGEEATSPSTPTPAGTPTEQPPATAEAGSGVAVQYYLLREHESGLWAEPLTTQAEGPAVARAAFEALAGGPTGDLQRLLPEGTTVLGVDIDPDGTLTVDFDLGEGGSGLGSAYEELLVQTIALTGTQFDGVERVQVLIDGAVPESLFGHVDVSQPIEPDPFAISPIIIEEAAGVPGSGVGGGSLELAGTANVFEATFDIALLDAGGNPIEETFVMADCGTGCRGEWTHAFTDLEPGTYTVVAREPDPSGGEGRPPFEVREEVTVPQP